MSGPPRPGRRRRADPEPACTRSALGLPDHLLLVPEDADPGAQLVVWFHGAGGHAARSVPTVRAAAADAGPLVLLPSSAAATSGPADRPDGR